MWFNSGVSWICLQQWWSWQWWVCQESVFPQVWKCLHHWIKCTEDYSWPSLQTKHLTTSINCLIILIKYKMYFVSKENDFISSTVVFRYLHTVKVRQFITVEAWWKIFVCKIVQVLLHSLHLRCNYKISFVADFGRNCLVKVDFSKRVTWMSTFSRKSCQWKHLIFLKNSLIICFRQCYTM